MYALYISLPAVEGAKIITKQIRLPCQQQLKVEQAGIRYLRRPTTEKGQQWNYKYKKYWITTLSIQDCVQKFQSGAHFTYF